jgi:signal transduction histidine kinase
MALKTAWQAIKQFYRPRDRLPDTFAEEMNHQAGRILPFLIVCSPAWLGYIPIDRQLHPDASLIPWLRAGFSAFALLALGLLFVPSLRRQSQWLLFMVGAYLTTATAVITGLTGADPTYMAGYILVLCLCAIAPIQRRFTFAALGLSVIGFAVSLGITGTTPSFERLRYSMTDYGFTVVIVTFFTFILDGMREKAWFNASSAVQIRNQKISDLLHNVRQGILLVNRDLRVGAEYSAACLHLLKRDPAGVPVDALLSPEDPHQGEHMRLCLSDAMDEADPIRRQLYLSLLPALVRLGDRHLSTEYLPLKEGVMITLTDTTEQARLSEQLHSERRRLELIVCAVSDSRQFFELVEDFRGFVQAGAEPWRRRSMQDLYRQIHTLKGSFLQMGFDAVPKALHEAEELLRRGAEPVDGPELLTAVFRPDWTALLESDLAGLRSALGDEFVHSGGVFTLKPQQAELIEGLARERLANRPDIPEGLRQLALIRHTLLAAELQRLDAMAQRVASDLERKLFPLRVEGDTVWMAPGLRPFLMSLGHLIRNAVDHGNEDPAIRTHRGKPEAGQIVCRVSHTAQHLSIEIADDGAGIDEAMLRKRAQARPELSAIAEAPLAELVFADGLSAREEVTAISGRGVGMSAVAAEVHALGGQIDVASLAGAGTTVRICLPLAGGGIQFA